MMSALASIVAAACSAATICPDGPTRVLPADPSEPGPWPVGARTVEAAGLKVEAWYPAVPGSEAGRAKASYDLREHFPGADRAQFAAGELVQPCECFRDLPPDAARGPFPVVVFVHGAALFRTEATFLTTHWASRGAVVLAADHPHVTLRDALARGWRGDPEPEVRRLLDALKAPAGGLAFLARTIDPSRVAVVGHSHGGGVAGRLGDRPEVLLAISLAEAGTRSAGRAFHSLVIGGLDDRVEPFERQSNGWASSPSPKLLVGIPGAGHMAFSDLCALAPGSGGLFAVARRRGLNVDERLSRLLSSGCAATEGSIARTWRVVRHATSAAIEEVLACSGRASRATAGIAGAFPDLKLVRDGWEPP